MSKVQRIASLAIGLAVVLFLHEFDNLALEHDAGYGLMKRGVVWLLMLIIALASYENLQKFFWKNEK